MTELLYLPDNDHKTEFKATVTESSDEYFALNKTAFYKKGGGQPSDKGKIKWNDKESQVNKVVKDHGTIKHYTNEETPPKGQEIKGKIDRERRNKLTRMHTAQHVLSLVVLEQYNAATAGNQIHEEKSRIDFKPVSFSEQDLDDVQEKANELIQKDSKVKKEYMPRNEVEEKVKEGRTNLELIPSSVDPLRVVKFKDDICPCGGTHVDSLKQIGKIDIIGRETKGKNTERLRFKLSEEPQ